MFFAAVFNGSRFVNYPFRRCVSLCIFVIALNRVAADLANGSCKSDFGTGRLGYCLFVTVRNFIRVVAFV